MPARHRCRYVDGGYYNKLMNANFLIIFSGIVGTGEFSETPALANGRPLKSHKLVLIAGKLGA